MTTKTNVHRKLSTARQRVHLLNLKKTGKFPGGRGQYYELGDFIAPALQVFDEIGLGATISFDREYATMTVVDLDNPEDRIVLTSPMGSAALKGCHEVQNIGAVETYQRRYLWMVALELVEHDALDASAGTATSDGKVSTEQLERLQDKANAVGADLARFCAYFQVPSLKHVPAARYDEALAALDAKAKRNGNLKQQLEQSVEMAK